MSIINKVLGLFLGNKYERDMKEITPYVEKIHIEFEKLKDLTNDQLRDKTLEIKSRYVITLRKMRMRSNHLRRRLKLRRMFTKKRNITMRSIK